MSKRNSRLRGIVVVADTEAQVQDHFRAVASGNYRVFESLDGETAIATSDTADLQIMNPLNGEEMVAVPDEDKHDMTATASSGEEMEAFYLTCASGCGQHIIADQQELLDKCPACASDLPNLEEPELKNAKKYPEILLAVASSQEEAADAYRALASGDCETFAALCDGTMVISNQPLKFDIYRGTAADGVENHVPQIAVAANAEGNVHAHYFTTAADNSEEGQLHIISSDATPIFCPQTSSGLVDPAELPEQNKGTASDDDEDEDDFEDDEDDEDDEEEEDDEEDEDEDDEDDDLSLSLANSETGKPSKKGGVRKKVKATASAQTEESEVENENKENVATAAAVSEKVALTASFVAYAANDMKADTVEVAYAGNIAGEPTWVAFHNGVPFAKAIASAAENPATFADDSFGRAFKAVASEQGVHAAMSQLKFEEIRPVVDVEKLVQTEVESRVTAQAAEMAEAASRDAAELSGRFEAALATAAQGVNRGFWKQLQNPVRVALASTLDDLGIQGGDELLQRAFAEHSDAYNKLILAKASEIIKLDLTVQNQLAESLNDVQEQNVAVASTASLSVGRPVKQTADTSVNRETATAASQTDDFSSKLKTLRF